MTDDTPKPKRADVPPSRKIKAARETCLLVLGAMVIATVLKTPPELASNALWIIGMVGGVTVGGQALVDKVAAKGPKP